MWDAKTFKRRFSLAVEEGNRELLDELRISVFKDTVACVQGEHYFSEHGKTVRLPLDRNLMKNSILYSKDREEISSGNFMTNISVEDRDCLLVASTLGNNPLVLNMADNTHPGGGVEQGSGAQEESLFRSSNYFLSMYQFDESFAQKYNIQKSKSHYPLDNSFGSVYSPKVTIFRGPEEDGYPLLDTPFTVSFLAVSAIRQPTILADAKKNWKLDTPSIELTKTKIRTIFKGAMANHQETLVLSAFGCGAFCNPPEHMAALFHEVLREKTFLHAFKSIVFAIKDDHNSHKWYNPEGNYQPFAKEFKRGKI
ncbi:TIGR02452 family protein [uncultured Sphaerochaeta sp.]|uniref:TIGR02452 family protein n=1 Tax=uncultured Sphaerochaeta sp. TaxID=886478 RepID=UPI002A0A6AF3|nr:TIGR02452 family protein [uncultured Sphaerochaeta sp.]